MNFEVSFIHWRIYPLYFHHNILYKTKLQLRSTNNQNHCAQTLLIRLQHCPQHTSSHAHINCHGTIEKQWPAILCLNLYTREWHDYEVLIITSFPVCRTQSSVSFSIMLASLFGSLLFTYRLRRRGITVACFQ